MPNVFYVDRQSAAFRPTNIFLRCVLTAVVLPDRNDRVLTGRGGIATIKVLMRAEFFANRVEDFIKGWGVCSTGELVGRIVHFPDKWWGFEAVGRSHHPAVCSGYHPGGYKAVMVKGTDLRSARYAYAQVVVEPDEKNGLSKTTSFAIRPKVFSGQRISVLDQIGSLGSEVLREIQQALSDQFGLEVIE